MLRIVDFIVMFYINELISLKLMEEGTTFIPSHAKFHEDFYKFKDFFDSRLAQIFHDYIIFSAVKELTEAWNYCEESPYYLLGEKIYYLTDDHIRCNIYKLDLKAFYEMAEYMFGKTYWDKLFGGEKWYKAIKIDEFYEKIPNSMFCDLVIDLQHNTGSLLGKMNPYFSTFSVDNKLRKIINKKAKKTNFNNMFDFLFCSIPIQDKRIVDIYWRFITLYFADDIIKEYYLTEIQYSSTHFSRCQNDFFAYKPIQYNGRYKTYDIRFSCDIEDEYNGF